MRKLSVFNFLSLDGYYKGPGGDLSWHKHGEEENQYTADSLGSDSILLFGRVTYEMMAGYWPSPMAMQNDPVVAQGMNSAEKIVLSKSMKKADWSNTVVKNSIEEIAKFKKSSGKDITLLGSGNVLTQLARNGLIDEYQIMIDPVAIGSGTSIFAGLKQPLSLKLKSTRTFKSGVVLLCYN